MIALSQEGIGRGECSLCQLPAGKVRTDSCLQGCVRRIDALHGTESGLEQRFLVLYLSGQQDDRDVLSAGFPQDAGRNLAHQGLAVGTSFACDDQVGIVQEGGEIRSGQYQFNAGL